MRKLLSLLLAITIVLSSCAFIEQTKDTIVDALQTNEQKDAARAAEIRGRVAQLVNDRKYAEALSLIGNEVKGGRSERSFGNLYVASVNGLAGKAVVLLRSGEYGPAGIAFRKVLDHYPTDGGLLSEMDYSSVEVISFMNVCSDKIMEKGLMEYRKGNLGNAISLWQDILKFDPDHEEATRAIDTATVQLNNLKKIEKK
jgi:tetratricopeptide (TPR) repeat protein